MRLLRVGFFCFVLMYLVQKMIMQLRLVVILFAASLVLGLLVHATTLGLGQLGMGYLGFSQVPAFATVLSIAPASSMLHFVFTSIMSS